MPSLWILAALIFFACGHPVIGVLCIAFGLIAASG